MNGFQAFAEDLWDCYNYEVTENISQVMSFLTDTVLATMKW